MKRSLIVVCCGLFLFAAACTKDDGNTTPVYGPGGTMSANIDGVNWSASEYYLSQPSVNIINIHGARNSTKDIIVDIGMSTYSTPGEYALGDSSKPNKALLTINGVNYYSTSGKLTVTKDDGTNIEGSFEFDAATPTFVITTVKSGKFTYRKK